MLDGKKACTMSNLISCSKPPGGDVWMAQSALFDPFMKMVAEYFPDDALIANEIEIGIITQGICLEILYADHPQQALALRDVILAVAEDITEGRVVLVGRKGKDDEEYQKIVRTHFGKLVAMLSRWQPEESDPAGSHD